MTPLHILVAEDEAVIAMLLEEVLVGMGHSVCATVSTADEMIAAAKANRPDLIIADAGLRDSSGLSAVAVIMEAGNIPHIFMSGNATLVRLQCPDTVVLAKPFDEDALESAIAKVMMA